MHLSETEWRITVASEAQHTLPSLATRRSNFTMTSMKCPNSIIVRHYVPELHHHQAQIDLFSSLATEVCCSCTLTPRSHSNPFYKLLAQWQRATIRARLQPSLACDRLIQMPLYSSHLKGHTQNAGVDSFLFLSCPKVLFNPLITLQKRGVSEQYVAGGAHAE